MKVKCKHRKMWIIANGAVAMAWCYQCGAIRNLKPIPGTTNGLAPKGRWTKPTGPGGENPAMKNWRG